MKLTHSLAALAILALVLLASAALGAAADEITGTWKTAMVDPCIRDHPCPVHTYSPTFEFKVDGDKLDGAAHMEEWPGDARMSEGKVDGDRITFTLVHEMGYSTQAGTFRPRFRCEGTIRGDEMELNMTRVDTDERKYEMKGTRISK